MARPMMHQGNAVIPHPAFLTLLTGSVAHADLAVVDTSEAAAADGARKALLFL